MEEEKIIKDNNSEETKVKKQKDPKKVAAGKALAKKNDEARKVMKESKNESTEEVSLSFFDINNDIQKAAGLVASGFMLYHGFKFYKSFRKTTPMPATPKPATPEPKSIDF